MILSSVFSSFFGFSLIFRLFWWIFAFGIWDLRGFCFSFCFFIWAFPYGRAMRSDRLGRSILLSLTHLSLCGAPFPVPLVEQGEAFALVVLNFTVSFVNSPKSPFCSLGIYHNLISDSRGFVVEFLIKIFVGCVRSEKFF